MLGTSLLGRLRRRDPGDAILRRAARLTLVASVVFYGCRYGAGSSTLATYGLFGTIAAGSFAQLPGPAPQRARILVLSLPVVWALIAAGSLLAWSTWAAAGGMLVVGFVVAFAGVGNPRLVGLASAFQLFYILASFPPYQPGTLPERLGGVTLAVVLLAAAEVFLWPDPVPVSYRQRLAEAADGVAAFLDAAAETLTDPHAAAGDRDSTARAGVRRGGGDRAEPQPSGVGAHRGGRSGSGVADLRGRVTGGARRGGPVGGGRPAAADPGPGGGASAALVRGHHPRGRPEPVAGCPGGDPGRPGRGGRTSRGGVPGGRRPGPRRAGRTPVVPGRDSVALADQVRVFVVGSRVATGARLGGDDASSALFEYARRSPWTLYWWQFRSHLAPRSAHLHSSLRLAVALAIARVAAGVLQLTHGFWVLLATLTRPAHVGRRHPHRAAAGRAGHDHRCGRQRRGDARRRRAGRVRHRPAGHPAAGLRRRPPARSGVAAGAVHTAADRRLRPTQPGRVAARRGPPRRRAARRGDRRARRRGDLAARRGPRPAAQRHPLPGGQRGRGRADGPVDARRCSATRACPRAGSVAGWS